MKSTGEAIGYDNTLNRALYKAMLSSGMNVSNYGTLFVPLPIRTKPKPCR
jgi:carbamoyl-phosphate synthase large subunit